MNGWLLGGRRIGGFVHYILCVYVFCAGYFHVFVVDIFYTRPRIASSVEYIFSFTCFIYAVSCFVFP